MASGTVKWFYNKKGHDFIQAKNGKDIFVYFSTIQSEGFKTLNEGQTVELEIKEGPKGPQAENVVLKS